MSTYTELSGHDTLTFYCSKCGTRRVVALRCGRRSCPECRRKDYWRLLKGYETAVKLMVRPKLLTLTLLNKPYLTAELVRRLRACFKKLMRRKRYRNRVRGGLYSIEAVNKGRGWHVHMHVLFDGDFLEQGRLSRDWREITGGSFIVDIRRAHGPKGGLAYILKYLTKPPQVDGRESLYNAVLKGVRLVQPFGRLYGQLVLKDREKPVCEECGCAVWIPDFELTGLSRMAVVA